MNRIPVGVSTIPSCVADSSQYWRLPPAPLRDLPINLVILSFAQRGISVQTIECRRCHVSIE